MISENALVRSFDKVKYDTTTLGRKIDDTNRRVNYLVAVLLKVLDKKTLNKKISSPYLPEEWDNETVKHILEVRIDP